MGEKNDKVSSILKKIVARRKKLGISQVDLALKLNMSANGYFKVEKGITKLDLYRLIEIAEILKIDPKEFF